MNLKLQESGMPQIQDDTESNRRMLRLTLDNLKPLARFIAYRICNFNKIKKFDTKCPLNYTQS